RLTDGRVRKLRELLQVWADSSHVFTCEELMSLVGKLEFATVVVRAGTAFLRRIRGLMMSLKNKRGTGHSHRGASKRLDKEALLDVQWWFDVFLTSAGNRRAIVEQPWTESVQVFTDACLDGFGARCGNKWFQGQWSEAQKKFALVNTKVSMPYLELHALTQAAVTWGEEWRGKRVTFCCDAEAAVRAVQVMRSRRDSLSELLRLLYATAAKHDFEFRCEHLPGVTNVIADALSRNCSLQELQALLPTAEARPTPAKPLPVDWERIIPWPDPMLDRLPEDLHPRQQ
ncbi:MAG: hypothetical protein ACR2OU_16505, partial [Thermomicrobiales bacterium]